jgi:hypothetical protein
VHNPDSSVSNAAEDTVYKTRSKQTRKWLILPHIHLLQLTLLYLSPSNGYNLTVTPLPAHEHYMMFIFQITKS